MSWSLSSFAPEGERPFTTTLEPDLPALPAAIRRLSPVLLAGEGAAHVAHDLLGNLLARGHRVVVADGANGFDAYHLANAARRIRRPIPTLLAAVRVSRAFTWQQYVALLERDVAAEAARSGAAWVLALGPVDLLADEEVKPFQALRAARRVADALRALGRAGLGVIAAQDDRPLRKAAGRDVLRLPLERACGHLVTVRRLTKEEAAAGRPAEERPAAPEQLALPWGRS